MTDDAATPGGPISKIDRSVPHSARIWNYWLGGTDNYDVDRAAGDAYCEAFPGIVHVARASRHFLARSIRYLAQDAGVRQFLDVGTGLPTADNTHQIAQRVAPESRVVYVDNDPLVLLHAHALLTSAPEGVTEYLEADLRDPAGILAAAGGTLDLTRPVGLILSGILGHIETYEEARDIVRRLMAGLPSGSYLSLNEGTDTDPEYLRAQNAYNASGAEPYRLRPLHEIEGFFDGLDLVPPGVVQVPRWRPDLAPTVERHDDIGQAGGVGRKP
ncbi:SAM-dependent methyltransferase [Streptomyces sp. RFCAC02]|uniref:SAM-dependent methyltransferase n=1 Tax=Streptomyces sp. RFCAC02 TaxID=2499143 RepID=UPI001F0F8339|nr:SAM-dependent methyltransferase [Streptomyces sp. RFCAC02]